MSSVQQSLLKFLGDDVLPFIFEDWGIKSARLGNKSPKSPLFLLITKNNLIELEVYKFNTDYLQFPHLKAPHYDVLDYDVLVKPGRPWSNLDMFQLFTLIKHL